MSFLPALKARIANAPVLNRLVSGKASSAPRAHKWLKRLALTLGVLVVLIVGLLILIPTWGRAKLEAVLSAQLERPATVAKLRFNPFALALEADGVRIGGKTPEAPALLAFTRLRLDLSSASLPALALIFDGIELDQPQIHLSIDKEGKTSIDDLIAKFSRPDDPKEESSGLPRFALHQIDLKGGALMLDDAQRGQQQAITEIMFSLPEISSLDGKDAAIAPSFSAKINGAPIQLAGQAQPFEAALPGRFKLAFDDLDLSRFAAFVPTPLPRIAEGKLSVDVVVGLSREGDWRVALDGGLKLTDVLLTRGDASLGLKKLALQMKTEDILHAPQHFAQIEEEGLVVRQKTQTVLAIESLSLDRVDLDLSKRLVDAGVPSLAGVALTAAQLPGGQIDLVQLLQGFVEERKEAKPVREKAKKAVEAAIDKHNPESSAENPVWHIKAQGATLVQGKIAYTDQTKAGAPSVYLDGLAVSVSALDSLDLQPLEMRLASQINKGGNVLAEGEIDVKKLKAKLKLTVDKVDLMPFEPFVPHFNKLVPTKATATLKGNLDFTAQPLAVRYAGSFALSDFALRGEGSERTLLQWREASIAGLDVAYQQGRKPKIHLEDAKFSRLFARLLVTSDGHLQLDRIFRAEGRGATEEETPTPPLPPTPEELAQQKQFAAVPHDVADIRIGRVRLDNAVIVYNDQFVKPNYSANISALNGDLGPFSPAETGKVNLAGKVNRTGTLSVEGELSPLAPNLALDITAKARGIELPGFSPYSGRYLGYRIKKGKLSADVHYTVKDAQLTAQNTVRLNQLTLGEQVKGENAPGWPVHLALSLLTDSDGVIRIDLPISGSLNDPQFSLGGLIWKAIGNLFLKAVASPFTLLSSVFSGGQEMSQIDFAPGQSALSDDAVKRLEGLAKALNERPSLNLEITGQANPGDPAEVEGLKRYQLDVQMRLKKRASLGSNPPSLADISLSPDEKKKYMGQLYRAGDFDKPLLSRLKLPPIEEMEPPLLAAMKLSDAQFQSLATRRAEAARTWLLETGKIPPKRIFLLAPEVAESAPEQPAKPPTAGQPPATPETSAPATGTSSEKPGSRVVFGLQ
ncbi:MAG: DUF748 domain-containing protein [Zoogloeaceae bacterium]|jgi:uncharacterized protein involved in outer membrane biogenesis|nr:DUF748 domain-containing protein [Zoogloeaceae bacterium]